MRRFAALYQALDSSTSLHAKQEAMMAYLQQAQPADAAWAVYFFSGGKPRQIVPVARLKTLTKQLTAWPDWLFDECYDTVGDLAETLALLLPEPQHPRDIALHVWMSQHLLPLRAMDEAAQCTALLAQWDSLLPQERLVYFKLITGAFRVGFSRLQMTQVLAQYSGVDRKAMAQRLMGYAHLASTPTADDFLALIAPQAVDAPARQAGEPYPFFLAHPVPPASVASPEVCVQSLGALAQWQVEWKWDGIRAQLVKRGGEVWLWSRGEELMTDRFPELVEAAQALPDGLVLDGEILVLQPGTRLPEGVQPFASLQKRIGRKRVTRQLMDSLPVVLLCYDLLELAGEDMRAQPLSQRRMHLDALLADGFDRFPVSPCVHADDWATLGRIRQQARSLGTEGFMLKARDAQYGVGRTRDVGIWWKWKIDPMQVDAVLIYAQRGHGRRASLYSDYTFAVWSGPPEDETRELVPFAKAYSGLSDKEMAEVDAIIRKTTRESFGPVRSVTPTLVFELGFEGISRSTRHKSGLAVRFPRMLRWRQDKAIQDADSLQTLEALLPSAMAAVTGHTNGPDGQAGPDDQGEPA